MLVFARRMDEPTARLMRALRDTVRQHRERKLFAWVVFLTPPDTASQTAFEREAEAFARRSGTTGLPVSVLGDPKGPPGYLIAEEAAVTVLLFRSGTVVHNRAYRAREWTAGAASSALKGLPDLLEARPGAA